jgi:hypothetical protein
MRVGLWIAVVLSVWTASALGAENVSGAASATNAPARGLAGILDAILGGSKQPQTNSPASSSADSLGTNIIGRRSSQTNSARLDGVSTNEVQSALKQALAKGFDMAIARLGQTNGFLTNVQVKIPVPEQLAAIERGLRKIHEDALVDQFEATMNHAAEKAVPAASDVLLHAVQQVSIQDATSLLTSKSVTAVTDYFRKTSETNLFDKFLPIVREATESSGATAAYKKVLDRLPFNFGLFSKNSLDLDNYVTTKALDGLFKMAADEEKSIRENPRARTTELLEKVFGAVTN